MLKHFLYERLPLTFNSLQTKGMGTSAAQISSLPTEILLSIFLLCLPTTNDYVRRERFNLKGWAPLTLTRVSRLWYRLAVSSSQLWTVLYFGSRYGNSTDCNRVKEAMILWEERSNGLPLEISIRMEVQTGDRDVGQRSDNAQHAYTVYHVSGCMQAHREAWDTLMPYLSRLLLRCNRVEIGNPSPNFMRLVESSRSIRELVILSEHRTGSYYGEHHFPTIMPTEWFLRMRVFESYRDSWLHFPTLLKTVQASPPSALHNLQRLVLRCRVKTDEIHFLLATFPTLVELELELSPLTSAQKFPRATSNCARLTRLSITTDDFKSTVSSAELVELEYVSLPVLETLHLSLSASMPATSAAAIVKAIAAAVRRSESPITAFRLDWRLLQRRTDIGVLLRELPALRSLHFVDWHSDITRQVVDALTEVPLSNGCGHTEEDEARPNRRRCQSLEEFHFEETSLTEPEAAVHSLARLFATQPDICTKLKRLVIIRARYAEEKTDNLVEALLKDEEIKRLLGEGLELIAKSKDLSVER